MPALSRKNSGEEVEGKEKSKTFIGKAECMRKDAWANSVRAVSRVTPLESLNPF